jgi:hypothetical protein
MWEIRCGAERTAAALFITDTETVRPDLAERTWIALASGSAVGPTRPVSAVDLDRLRSLAADHEYRDPRGTVPSLSLRLAVRVEP